MSEEPPSRECVRCGYNLHALDPHSRCPECGVPVADSLRGNRLDLADRVWLNRIYYGCQSAYWSGCCLVVGVVLFVVAGIMVTTAQWSSVFLGLIFAVVWSSTVALLIGGVLLTSQDPAAVFRESALSWRRVVAPGLGFAVVGVVVRSMLPALPGQVVSTACVIALLMGVLGTLQVSRQLANRVPDPPLADRFSRSFRRVAWVGSIFFVAHTCDAWVPAAPAWVTTLNALSWLALIVVMTRAIGQIRGLIKPLVELRRKPLHDLEQALDSGS